MKNELYDFDIVSIERFELTSLLPDDAEVDEMHPAIPAVPGQPIEFQQRMLRVRARSAEIGISVLWDSKRNLLALTISVWTEGAYPLARHVARSVVRLGGKPRDKHAEALVRAGP